MMDCNSTATCSAVLVKMSDSQLQAYHNLQLLIEVGLLVAAVGLVTVIAGYSLAGRDAPLPVAPTPAKRACPYCGAEAKGTEQFCPICGRVLPF